MFESHVYTERRNRLKKLVNNGIALFLGNKDMPMNYKANTYRFRQDSNFLYFFGLNAPDLAAVIDFESGEEIIFGNDVDLDTIIWTGPQASVKEKAATVGVSDTRPLNKLSDFVSANANRLFHFLPPYRDHNKLLIEKLLGIKPDSQQKFASPELIKAVVELRSVKEPCEINALEEVMEMAYDMHTTGMKMIKSGIYEREVYGAMEGIALSYGGAVSFPIILTVNGQTLHNHYHGNKMRDGDLLLIDAGVEAPNHYSSDHTRTYPVSGRFSTKQKEIYETVLKANKEAIEMIKPDVPFRDIHLYAAKVIVDGLKEVGLMKGDTEEAVAKGAHALFFPHGLGHMMGLDVHDMEDLGENYVGYDEEIQRSSQFGTAFLRFGRKLKKGFVLTVEPGIYFIPALIDKWRKEAHLMEFINYNKLDDYRDFGGIRIEDDILVTESAYKILGKMIPKEVDDIEQILSEKI